MKFISRLARVLSIVVALTSILKVTTFAAEALPNQATINQLTSREPLQRVLSRRQLSEDRRRLIEQLLEIAQKKQKTPTSFPDGKFDASSYDQFNPSQEMAINLLGDYRASEAANLLTRLVLLKGEGLKTSDVVLGDFPSAKALVKIGQPSIRAIFNRLSPIEGLVDSHPLDQRDLHLFAYIIREIDGEEVGLFRLQLALKNAKTELQKKNFGNLIEIYQKNESEGQIKEALLPDEIAEEARKAAQKEPQPK